MTHTDANTDRSYDTIIIGCGSAGIAAGIQFLKFEPVPRFLILEARNYVGGRVHTDTNTFRSIEPVDLGARCIHHYRPENPLATYHTPSNKDRMGYQLLHDDKIAFYDIDGTILPNSLLRQAESIVENFQAKVRNYPKEKEDVSIYDVIRDEYEKIQDEQMRRLVDMNLSYIEHYEASNINQLSAKLFFKADNDLPTCNLILPIGLGTFVKEIADRYSLPVQLNAIVKMIEIPNDQNQLIHIITQDDRHYWSKYILITIPLGCLKRQSITFEPELPDWKKNAIDRMGFGLFNKVYLQFPFTFWDETIDAIRIPSDRFKLFFCFPKDNMLLLHICDRIAYELEQLSDEDIIEQVLKILQPIYSQIPKPIKWLITRWGNDPYSYGSYSNFAIGTNDNTLEALSRECYNGRVHWAGEHTNYDGTIGCVDSAFESGYREAKLIYKKINNNY